MYLGLLFGVLSATFDSLGFVVQKKGHLEAARQKKYFLKNPIWILGQICTILAIPFLLAALNLSSQTALSFIPALAILFISLWSRLILKIKLSMYDLIALLFLIPGVILIVTFSIIEKITINSWELSKYLFSIETIIFISLMSIMMVGLGIPVY